MREADKMRKAELHQHVGPSVRIIDEWMSNTVCSLHTGIGLF